MTKGEIVKVYERGSVRVKILEHKSQSNEIGKEYDVCRIEERFELVSSNKLTKEELLKMPLGSKMTLDTENNNTFIKVGENDWCNDDCDHLSDDKINDDLTVSCWFASKIIKVEEPSEYITKYDRTTEAKEMTLKEVCEALGYEVKIIKEDK